MASASPISVLGIASIVVLAAAVSGCATTQDANKRASIVADRTLASREPLKLEGRDRHVQVVSTSVVNGGDGSAIVVVLRNRGDDAVNDLPIEVGVRGGPALNAGRNVPYFQSHAPAMGAGEESTWVYTSKDRISGPAFALVGAPASPPFTTARDVPELVVSAPHAVRKDGSVRAEIANDTGVPQYALDVYAVARKGDRYVAAGRASVLHLGPGQKADLRLSLVGDAKGSRIQIFAPPTLFE